MRARSTWALLAVSLLSAAAVAAQEQMSGPPPVLAIGLEEINPGSMAAHDKQVAAYMALFNRANVQGHRLGLVPVSGDDNQVVYLQPYASFADLEATRKQTDEAFAASPALQAELDALDRQTGSMHATQKTLIAAYSPDLSYRPVGPAEVGKSRYFSVTTNRIKAGRTNDYEGYVKQYNRAREKANLNEHSAVYQVITGAPSGTFITLGVNRSLTEWDDFSRGMQARTKAVDEALGGEVVVKQRRDTAEAIFADSRSSLYSLNPRISRAPAEVAAADPDFWTPKATGKALAVKKETKK
jgi:hypothetical protein